jgi:hypothetical protein
LTLFFQSLNGVAVNSVRVLSRELKHNDILTLGGCGHVEVGASDALVTSKTDVNYRFVLVCGALSPGLQRRDLSNRPRAQTPLVLDPVRALPPTSSPSLVARRGAPGRMKSPSKPIVRDAYQPLADARRRGTLLGASGAGDTDDVNNDDEAAAAAGTEAQYQDIPSKWAPDIAKDGAASSPATLSPRGLPMLPAGVRRSEEVTHYGSSKMLQQGVAGAPKAGLGRPSFDIRDDKAPF